uniref:Capsid protein n=1 Tax=Astrovirus deer/CcAstV-1/DNK/2010 TaxID=909307 RepID=E3UK91_9VIRU|nr:capsid protein [Astrovirus deer/CcAstV-1/DNK/2010]
MASRRQQNRRATRNTTNIVVRNGAAANQAGAAGGRRRWRNRKNNKTPQVNLRVLPSQAKGVRRGVRRQGLNNRVVFQKINTTLGTVGSNGSSQIECELTCLMNPATMKEATGSNSFGPLSIYASTYSLFRMSKCVVTLKPLVGDSAVSGTIARVSWNPTSTPTQTSWSALGARKHIDVTPGKTGKFVLTARDLVGPKGGWYKTMTKGDPMMSFAGTLEVHTLGQTMSTYKNEQFTGGLFLAELETEWQFKDYSQQPGMLNLIKGEDTQQAQITTDGTGKLQLVVPNGARMARAANGATSEIIWLVTDTIIQAGTSVFPPPFSWLIRGGWWLVKRAAGAPVRADQTTFDVYASISDARADTPCISTTVNADPINVGGLHFQQVTPGNTGIGMDQQLSRIVEVPTSSAPTQCYVTASKRLKFGNSNDFVPSFCAWYTYPNSSQNHNNGIGFVVGGERIGTYNLHQVTALTNVGAINPDHFPHKIPVYLMYNSTNQEEVGFAVAAQYDIMDNSPSLRVSSVLFYATANQAYNYDQQWYTTTVQYPVNYNNNPYNAVVKTPTSTVRGGVRLRIQQGQWYVAQFVTQGVVDRQYTVGSIIVASHATSEISTEDNYFLPHLEDADSGLLPVYMTGLQLTVFSSSSITVDQYLNLDPAEYYDMPPLEEGEDADDEGEDTTDSDLELGPLDDYDDPPMSRLVVHPDVQKTFEILLELHPEREARLAANRLKPSDEYSEFTKLYHDALVDGLSPRAARAYALGL